MQTEDAAGGSAPIQREVANVLKVREKVGPRMDLMIDPACELNTFADVLRVGRACDEANFFWYEGPGKDLAIAAGRGVAVVSTFIQRSCVAARRKSVAQW